MDSCSCGYHGRICHSYCKSLDVHRRSKEVRLSLWRWLCKKKVHVHFCVSTMNTELLKWEVLQVLKWVPSWNSVCIQLASQWLALTCVPGDPITCGAQACELGPGIRMHLHMRSWWTSTQTSFSFAKNEFDDAFSGWKIHSACVDCGRNNTCWVHSFVWSMQTNLSDVCKMFDALIYLDGVFKNFRHHGWMSSFETQRNEYFLLRKWVE